MIYFASRVFPFVTDDIGRVALRYTATELHECVVRPGDNRGTFTLTIVVQDETISVETFPTISDAESAGISYLKGLK